MLLFYSYICLLSFDAATAVVSCVRQAQRAESRLRVGGSETKGHNNSSRGGTRTDLRGESAGRGGCFPRLQGGGRERERELSRDGSATRVRTGWNQRISCKIISQVLESFVKG